MMSCTLRTIAVYEFLLMLLPGVAPAAFAQAPGIPRHARSFHERSTDGRYPFNALPLRKNAARMKDSDEQRYRLSGYRYELTRPNGNNESSAVKLAYSDHGVMQYIRLYQQDTVETIHYVMDPDFDYGNEALLNIVPPPPLNGYLLRSQPDYNRFYGHYLSQEWKQKINNTWKVTLRINDRVRNPYGYDYATTYNFQGLCPYNYESNSTGAWVGAQWESTLQVLLTDCHTQQPYQEAREVRTYNDKHQQVLFTSYVKQGDSYVLSFSTATRYDDLGRDIERIDLGYAPDPAKTKKTTAAYDEKGNPITMIYILNGGDWMQTFRTIAARTDDQGYLYTYQSLVNGEWISSLREKYLYDSDNRLTYHSYEVWNADLQEWNLRTFEGYKYFKADLLSESQNFVAEGPNGISGTRQKLEYDENNQVIFSETSRCSGAVDCANANYTPSFKIYYGDHYAENLDYFHSYIFTDGHWVSYDSAANLYNDRGEIEESFCRTYTGTYPEAIDLDQRQVYTYDEFLVTGNEEESFPTAAYPNPAADEIYIDISFRELTALEAIDVNGRKEDLPFERLDETHCVAEVSHLKAGLYILRQKNRTKTVVQKLMKR